MLGHFGGRFERNKMTNMGDVADSMASFHVLSHPSHVFGILILAGHIEDEPPRGRYNAQVRRLRSHKPLDSICRPKYYFTA